MKSLINKFNRTQVFAIFLGAIYIAILLISTIYSEKLHSESLPIVDVVKINDVSIPMKYLSFSGGEYCINTIDQIDGPWVNRYVIKTIPVSGIEISPGILRVEDEKIIGVALVISSESGQLYEGTEVKMRIAKKYI